MKKSLLTLLAASVASSGAFALTLEVQRFGGDLPTPAGYHDVAAGINPDLVVRVSEEPFVDYLIPSNSGTAGIIAQKAGGLFIASSTVNSFGGANNLINPDRYQVVFEWEDGTPLPLASDFYGVSWSGWSNTEVANLTTRVNLATDAAVTVFHWFNDGWNYASGGHTVLTGHVLSIRHYNAAGTEIDSISAVLPSGGAESIFGDHRQFYSAIITATRANEGDYLIITNEGGNIGYKGTAVAIMDSGPTDPKGPGVFEDYDVENGWVDTGDWLGWVYVEHYPWVFNNSLQNWMYAAVDGWFYVVRPTPPAQ
ncbi:MAG: hypothetical protein LR015_12235 [Verrucomicrobia bacterium]|nr:hypothetical protein [Verrucomicrobiota bacterium]